MIHIDDDMRDDEEDDLDIDDLDDAFDDEDWDDIDDDEDEADLDSSNAANQAQTRTFVQKYFNFIVIGFVCLLGILWFLGQGGPAPTPTTDGAQSPRSQDMAEQSGQSDNTPGNTAPTKSTEPPSPVTSHAETDDDSQLPMPVPMSAATDHDTAPDDVLPDTAGAPPLQAAESAPRDILTPLPDMTPEPPLRLDTDLGTGKEENPGMRLPGFEKRASLAGLLDKEKEPTKTQDNSKQDWETVKNEISQLDRKLAENITMTEQRLASLQKTLESLERKIGSISDAPAVKNVPVVSTKTPKTDHVAKPQTQGTATLSQKNAPVKKRPVSWELRSAQPGKAVVVRKGSSDFQTVEPGHRLSGIGRIKTISVENGRWVVRGTTGIITR